MFERFLTEVLKLAPRQMWGVEQQIEFAKEMFSSFSLKKFFSCLMAIIELCALTIFDLPVKPHGEELDLTGYNLVFEDEFNYDEFDTDVWEYRGSGERRGGFNAPSQVTFRDGNMVLTGEYKNGEYGEGWYTGMVRLKEWYCKGYFEIRCKVNRENNFWSAFWIQAEAPYTASVSKGGVGGAEIDIFESVNTGKYFDKDAVSHNIHCAGVDGEQEGYQSANLPAFYGENIYDEYNTYGLKWTDTEYIFYVNGVETIRSSFGNGVSEALEEVIVSLEIPDEDKLNELDKETYKTEFVVDYVRIYQ